MPGMASCCLPAVRTLFEYCKSINTFLIQQISLHQNTYGVLILLGGGFYLYPMKKEKTERTGKKQVGLEVTVEEKELAEKVAKERGVGFSALVRLLIKDEARRLGIV